ncbi:zeta toxin family protein [Kribbella sp. NPDC051718]|uniref:zeta toxin family protein n=1 Tax=Kribbella sp. NPDC051718 TaxID=3155168 RepID=UPI00343DD09A
MLNVLAGLGSASWSGEEAVRYEVALEGAGQVIGWYTELIAREEAAGTPDRAAIAGWREAQQSWAVRRRELSPLDMVEVAAIHSDGEDLLAEPDDEQPEPELVLRGLLDAGESERIFRERIVPDELTGTPQAQPIVVIVVGEPGDGKASITALARDVLERRGRPVVISTDLYAPHHPDFHQSMEGADARRWTTNARQYVSSRRFDVVLEAPSDFEQAAREFKAAGYQVEVAIVAVADAVSRFGVQDRHLRALEAYGYGRLAGSDQPVLRAAEALDRAQLADVAAVLRPNGELLYANQRGADGRWLRQPASAAAITAERTRPWTVLESRLFLEAVATFEHRGRSAPVPEIRQQTVEAARAVTALARPLLHPDAVTLQIATAGIATP